MAGGALRDLGLEASRASGAQVSSVRSRRGGGAEGPARIGIWPGRAGAGLRGEWALVEGLS